MEMRMVLQGVSTSSKDQQGGSGVMFWAGIIGNELVGPFRISDGVKMTAKLSIDPDKAPRPVTQN